MSKLYVIVRSDLSPAQQAVQAVHAAGYAIRDWPAAAEWPLALLCVSTSHDLRALQDGSFVEFHEPDLPHDPLTALAGHGTRVKRLTRGLPLALQHL